jgi:hypothetical protein
MLIGTTSMAVAGMADSCEEEEASAEGSSDDTAEDSTSGEEEGEGFGGDGGSGSGGEEGEGSGADDNAGCGGGGGCVVLPDALLFAHEARESRRSDRTSVYITVFVGCIAGEFPSFAKAYCAIPRRTL